jgi:hypothetical protein
MNFFGIIAKQKFENIENSLLNDNLLISYFKLRSNLSTSNFEIKLKVRVD